MSNQIKSNDWRDWYTSWSNVYSDLIELVTEYCGESEHQGIEPRASVVKAEPGLSEHRKKLLRDDFLLYWNNAD